MSEKPPQRPHWYNPIGDPEPPPQVRVPRRGRARERMRRRSEAPGFSAPKWTWGVIAVTVLGVVGLIALFATIGAGTQIHKMATAVPSTAAAVGSTLQPSAIPTVNIRPWDGKQRFTILVLGLDKRPGEIGTGFRTDTVILLSVDPATKSIGMMSIPRDLFVPIPNQPDMQRINSVYVVGELQRPGAGPLLVMQTVQYNFGLSINSYVAVSFDAVIGLVDAIDGIDINVPQEIDDPEYPDMNFGYDPLHIPAGLIHMDGKLALKYARTRHQGTDYDRADRQQQVLLAIRQKALKADTLPRLAAQAPTIWNQISKGVLTDMSLDQMLSLGLYVKDIPASSIKRATVDDKYLQAIQYNHDSVVTLNRNIIGELMTQVFGENYNH